MGEGDDVAALHVPRGIGWPPRRETDIRGWRAGFAVRRDWSDGRHDLVAFDPDRALADREGVKDRAFWAHGPVRPRSWSIVVVSRRDFDGHHRRRLCPAPECPTPLAAPTAAYTMALRHVAAIEQAR